MRTIIKLIFFVFFVLSINEVVAAIRDESINEAEAQQLLAADAGTGIEHSNASPRQVRQFGFGGPGFGGPGFGGPGFGGLGFGGPGFGGRGFGGRGFGGPGFGGRGFGGRGFGGPGFGGPGFGGRGFGGRRVIRRRRPDFGFYG